MPVVNLLLMVKGGTHDPWPTILGRWASKGNLDPAQKNEYLGNQRRGFRSSHLSTTAGRTGTMAKGRTSGDEDARTETHEPGGDLPNGEQETFRPEGTRTWRID